MLVAANDARESSRTRTCTRKHHHPIFVCARFYMATASLVYLFIYLVFFILFQLMQGSHFEERMCVWGASFDANVYRFVRLMLVVVVLSPSPPSSSLLLLLLSLLEFRYESFYSRQSSNIVHEATHYIGRYASKPNDPNSPIVSNKTRAKQIATNQSKSKTNLIYAILGFMRPIQFLLHKAICSLSLALCVLFVATWCRWF